MPDQKKKKILVQPRRRSHREYAMDCNYSVTSTLLNIPDLGAVLVPWLVLKADPSGVLKNFQKHQREIMYDDWVNVFMTLPDLRESIFGSLDDFSQTWIIKVETPRDLSDIIYRLTSFPTVVSAFLRSNSLMQKSVDIPVIIILQPKAKCIENLIEKLQSVQRGENSVGKFYFEVDLGSSVARWGAIAMKEDLTVKGGRFAVGCGAPYNHMFDWQNVFCCVPCLPCCLVATPLYRLHRRLQYKQSLGGTEEPIVIVGTESTHPEDQARAIRNLMAWAKLRERPMRCRRCGQLPRSCTCKGHATLEPPPVIVQMAPADTKETEEIQAFWKARQEYLEGAATNGMQTLKDVKQFNDISWNKRYRKFYDDEDSASRGSVLSVIDETETTPRDVNPSVSLKSSGTFSIRDLRVFSIAAHAKIYPTEETKQDVEATSKTKDTEDKLF